MRPYRTRFREQGVFFAFQSWAGCITNMFGFDLRQAQLKLLRKLLKKMAFVPDKLVTDDLRSYGAAARELGLSRRHERGRWRNNRAENSHQPTRRRERKMQGFKSAGISPTISVRPRRHLQHLQRPASPHLSEDAPGIPSLGHADVARGDCCGVIAIE